MGITASTPANLVIGAGDVLLDDADLGATKDSNAFRIEQEYAVPELNGVPGELKGTHHKVRETAFLEASVPELSATIMAALWPGSQSATALGVTTIDSDGTVRRIPTTDYHDWELRVPGLDGKRFSFFVDDALNVDNLEFEAQDDDAAAPRVSVHSTWNAADLTASPHRIEIGVGGS